MNRQELIAQIKAKKSFLCIGLDPDPDKLPPHLLSFDNPVLEFNRQIIEATHDLCVAYKPNLAFYESMGKAGWDTIAETVKLFPENIFSIADAKRGDIGNTSKHYARAFFEELAFDSITVAPYMGRDSVSPFLEFQDKWVILLGATSNEGALDFQFLPLELSKMKVYEKVLSISKEWGSEETMMYVVGATQAQTFKSVREILPYHFLLVPGVGAQGGSLEEVARLGMNDDCGLLVNSSRGILYASNGEDFADAAREKALELQQQMASLLADRNII